MGLLLVSTTQAVEWDWFRTLSVPPACGDCTNTSFGHSCLTCVSASSFGGCLQSTFLSLCLSAEPVFCQIGTCFAWHLFL